MGRHFIQSLSGCNVSQWLLVQRVSRCNSSVSYLFTGQSFLQFQYKYSTFSHEIVLQSVTFCNENDLCLKRKIETAQLFTNLWIL